MIDHIMRYPRIFLNVRAVHFPRALCLEHVAPCGPILRGSWAWASRSNDKLENVLHSRQNYYADTTYVWVTYGAEDTRPRACTWTRTSLAHTVQAVSTIDIQYMPTRNEHPRIGTACRILGLVCYARCATMPLP